MECTSEVDQAAAGARRGHLRASNGPRLAGTLALLASLACGQGDAPPRLEEHAAWGGRPPPEAVDGVRVGHVDRGIQIMNGRDEPILYAVWALSHLEQFAPCAEPGPDCLLLDRGERVVVPLDAIVGYAPDEREAVVRWWRLTGEGVGRRPHDLHVIGVPFASPTSSSAP